MGCIDVRQQYRRDPYYLTDGCHRVPPLAYAYFHLQKFSAIPDKRDSSSDSLDPLAI